MASAKNNKMAAVISRGDFDECIRTEFGNGVVPSDMVMGLNYENLVMFKFVEDLSCGGGG